MTPARKRAALEMVEPQLGFEFLVLLLDGPSLVRESHELGERRGRRKIDEKVLDARREPQILFAQEPDFWSESPIAPFVGRRHAQGRKARGPRPIGAIAPRHLPP